MKPGAVVIGRNEGERLIRCLASLHEYASPIIYVDSGSTDGSVEAATAAGAQVLALDMGTPFTAARARNAGLEHLRTVSDTAFAQVVDGDCEMCRDWIPAAVTFLKEHPDVAVVAGRLRERFPQASVWNRLADAEWDTPPGEVDAVGGIALLRLAATEAVNGYRGGLIAGEEPEMCLRLRRKGWKIWRLDKEMALHDIAMARFGQWWRRARRHGHAIAEGVALHGSGPERYCVPQTRRALIWGAAVPLAAALGALATPFAWGLLLAWPIQVLRLRIRGQNWTTAFFLTLGKLPEAQGILGYHLSRLKGNARPIIEYK